MTLRIGVEMGERTLTAVWRAGGAWRSRAVPRRPDQALARDLDELLKPLARHRQGSRLAIAPPESYMRSVRLTDQAAAKPAEAVRELLPTMLPFEVERAQVSVRTRRVRGAAEVLVAACDREQLAPEVDALWQAGWPAAAVVPAGLALAHAARAAGALSQEPVLLMDIGERRTSLAVVSDGDAVYARDVAVGMSHVVGALTSDVSVGERVLRLSWEQAESLALRLGVPEPSSAVDAGELPLARYLAMIQPVLEQLAGEVRRTLAAGSQSGLTAPPARLLLSGAGARMPRVEAWLAQQLGMPVTGLDLSRLVPGPGPVSAIAAGLAAAVDGAPLDLQPPAARQRRMVAAVAARTAQLSLTAAVAVIVLAVMWHGRAERASARLRQAQARWEALQPVVSLQAAVEERAQLDQRLTAATRVTSEWLRRFAGQVPDAVRLSELGIGKDGRIIMAGEAQPRQATAEAELSQLRLALEEQGVCRKTQLSSNRGPELVTFTVECRLP